MSEMKVLMAMCELSIKYLQKNSTTDNFGEFGCYSW